MSKIEIQELKVSVTTMSPLHIGGRDDLFADLQGRTAKAGGRAVIPGPSFKGAFRSSFERLLIATYGNKDHMQPCIPSSPKTISKDEKNLNVYRSGGGCSYPKSYSICPACYFFGAQSLGGMLYIPFLNADCHTEDLYSLRLDRALGIGVNKTNREYEFVPENIVFSGIIEILLNDEYRGWKFGEARPLALKQNADAWLKSASWKAEGIIFKLLIPAIEAIDQIGGYRSKGFGKVKVEAELGDRREKGYAAGGVS